jgi:hypothetical protein
MALCAAAAPCLFAQALARTDLDRASELQRSVQQRFWDPRRQLYVSDATRPGAAEMWAAGIALSALNGACRRDPATYRPILQSYIASLDAYWDQRQPLGGYEPYPSNGDRHDKYYDDNAWMAIALTESFDLTGDTRQLDRARRTTDLVLSGWDEKAGGGIWWHEGHKAGTKNTCSNAPAAAACLMLAERLPPTDAAPYRSAARRIVDWTRGRLHNPDGRFGDNLNVATGLVNHGTLTYNTALMIRAQAMLADQTAALAEESEAERDARAADAFVDPRTGRYTDAVKWSHLLAEADLLLARRTTDAELAAHLRRRAKAAVNADYADWQRNPSPKLIDVASLARELWLIVEDDAAPAQPARQPG